MYILPVYRKPKEHTQEGNTMCSEYYPEDTMYEDKLSYLDYMQDDEQSLFPFDDDRYVVLDDEYHDPYPEDADRYYLD